MKILLVGGGTLGSVSPLLAVGEELKRNHDDIQCIMIGTLKGRERDLAKKLKMTYYGVPAGKFRRYFSLKNFLDIFVTFFGFFVALYLIFKLRPVAMLSAGSFVSVPVGLAAVISRVPIFIHQQDVILSLSNKILAPFAKNITASFDVSLKDFSISFGLLHKPQPNKIHLTGNPVRKEITMGKQILARKMFSLEERLPTLLVLGGSSGARSINQLIIQAKDQLVETFQVIHVTGPNDSKNFNPSHRYHPVPFLDSGLPHAYSVADLVVARAGASTISELAACKKASVVIPLPDSHQLANAEFLLFKRAAVIAFQQQLTPEIFTQNLRKLLFDHELQSQLKKNISSIMSPHAAKQIADIMLKKIYKS